MTIRIKYVFVDGKSLKLEFENKDLVAAYIIADRCREASARRKERRHTYSLDGMVYEGQESFTEKETPESVMIAKEERDKLLLKMQDLTLPQRRRLFLRMQGMSIREIADAEGVSPQRINRTLKQIYKNIF